jgi:hypothetical protein
MSLKGLDASRKVTLTLTKIKSDETRSRLGKEL